mgnify:CR=1 FL=1
MNQDIIKAFQKSNHRFITKIIREWYFNTEFTEQWLFNIYGSQLILESVFQRIQDTLGKSKKKNGIRILLSTILQGYGCL